MVAEISMRIHNGSAHLPGIMMAMAATTRLWPQRHLALEHTTNAHGVHTPDCGASNVFMTCRLVRLPRGKLRLVLPQEAVRPMGDH